ncbi:hypothetical protein HGA34_02645 [Candidatus Falkowbacteria bacterium]|nr:hypothetical protein [Candidatus Falkowbacteria bacterium]
MNTHKKNRFLALSALLVFALSSFGLVSPALAAGGSLYIAPANGTYVVGDKITVTVKAYTGGNTINAAEGVLNFDRNFLEVSGISKSGSIFSMWPAEPSYSNGAGSVSFGGGLTPPGFSGQSGKIISVTFKAKAVGSTQVRFSSGAILANDGKGSNVLETMGSATFNISAKDGVVPDSATKETAGTGKPLVVQDQKTAVITDEYNKPNITSATHPDQNTWYAKNNVEFAWEMPAGVTGVSYDFNKELNFDPKSESSGLVSSKAYDNVENGIWYLHLKLYDGKKWGTVDHYRVMLDNVRPKPFTIRVEQTDAGNWPKLYFKTKDDISGVQSYEIYVNSLEENKYSLTEDESQENLNIELSQLGYGDHTALIKVIDKAGNETVETVEFTIQPIETPVIKNYAREIKPSDQFFINGTALANSLVNIYIQDSAGRIAAKVVHGDKNGNWFYLNDSGLSNGRYFAWAEGENINGLKSVPTQKVSFLVTPPVFATFGSFVINYFTVITSLLFMIILIVALVMLLSGKLRKKLKKETVEVEDVLHQNMCGLKQMVDDEVSRIDQFKRITEVRKEGAKMKQALRESIDTTEMKILKEIKDVEEILK